MSKYRKIETRIWNDKKFNALSDDGKLLFFFLLTHPHLISLGAMRISILGLAGELNWNEGRLSKAFQEVLSKGIVRYDERALFLWLPNFLRYNIPESPNVVKSWSHLLDYLPECELKNELITHARARVESLSPGFREALAEAFRKAMPNQEQEQEQDIKHIREVKTSPVCSSNKSANTDINEVFEYWQKVMAKPKAILDQKRKSSIVKALKTYSVCQLTLAIDGCSKTPHNMGENKQKQRYDDIELICRNASNIERFMEAAEKSLYGNNNIFAGAL
jgi:hypothetical protein